MAAFGLAVPGAAWMEGAVPVGVAVQARERPDDQDEFVVVASSSHLGSHGTFTQD